MSQRDCRDNERKPKQVQAFFLFISQIGETRIWSEFERPITVPKWMRTGGRTTPFATVFATAPQCNRVVKVLQLLQISQFLSRPLE